jgi:hypothetical protein
MILWWFDKVMSGCDDCGHFVETHDFFMRDAFVRAGLKGFLNR